MDAPEAIDDLPGVIDVAAAGEDARHPFRAEDAKARGVAAGAHGLQEAREDRVFGAVCAEALEEERTGQRRQSAVAVEAVALVEGAVQGGAYSGVTGGGTQTNFNYFINGIQLGSDQAGQPLSEIMRNLTVYTNTGVA